MTDNIYVGLLNWLKENDRGKKLIKKITKILSKFVIFNLFVFLIAILCSGIIINRPYPVAKAFMISASSLNTIYIFPLSKIFGWGNPLTWPFYIARDSLYNVGMLFFPKNEGEREIWWFNIRWNEYIQVEYDEAVKYGVFTKRGEYPRYKIPMLQNWEQELYVHIEPFANAKISDPELKKEKLSRFVDLADSDIQLADCLLIAAGRERSKTEAIYFDAKKAEMYEKVYKIYENLKNYSSKHEKDSYNYYLHNLKYKDAQLRYLLANSIIKSKFGENRLECNDPMLANFAKSHKEYRDYYNLHKKELSFGERMRLQLYFSSGIRGLLKKYRSCPVLHEYNLYFKEKAKYLGVKEE